MIEPGQGLFLPVINLAFEVYSGSKRIYHFGTIDKNGKQHLRAFKNGGS